MEKNTITSDEVGKTYDDVKSLYNTYTENDNKTKVKTKQSYIEQILLYIFSWKLVFFVLLTVTLLILIVLRKIYEYVKDLQFYDTYGLDIISFTLYIIAINLFLVVFTISHYFYIKSVSGQKGFRGPMGKAGKQGANSYCNICSQKAQPLNKPKKLNINRQVGDLPAKLNTTTSMDDSYFSNSVILGNKTSSFKKESFYNNIKYLTGVITNINSDNIFDNIQFIYTNKDNNTQLSGGNDGIWGNKNKKNNVKEFQCPENSAIYKIEGIHQTPLKNGNAGIKGMKIYCRNTNTGENIELENNVLGIEPEEDSNYNFNRVQCDKKENNNMKYAGFVSDVKGNYNSEGLDSISFNRCSYVNI